jgi:hypothetical protein
MTDPARHPDSRGDADETDMDAGREPMIGMPRWVKVAGIVTIVVVLLFVVGLLSGRGHGPGRHARSDNAPHASAADSGPAVDTSPTRGQTW